MSFACNGIDLLSIEKSLTSLYLKFQYGGGNYQRHAGNLRADELDYMYFKLNRVEHILSLSVQVIDIDARVFACISEVKYWMASQLQGKDERGFQSEKVFTEDRGRPRYNISDRKNNCSTS